MFGLQAANFPDNRYLANMDATMKAEEDEAYLEKVYKWFKQKVLSEERTPAEHNFHVTRTIRN